MSLNKNTPAESTQRFFDLLESSIEDGTFVRLILGKSRSTDPTLETVQIRHITLHGAPALLFVYHHRTHDITKNLPIPEGLARIHLLLGADFHSAHLFTTAKNAQFEFNKKGEPRLSLSKPSVTLPPATSHDETKERLIPAGSPWLHSLGITTAEGRIRESMAAKFRQINKFVELLAHLSSAASFPANRPLSLVDMGAGKGYLTFAAYDYFNRIAGRKVVVRGIEVRPELVAFCNRAANEAGFTGLSFESSAIANTTLDKIDILIALHACDTATDDALFSGLRAGATLIVVAPCCHKELRPQLAPLPPLDEPLQHGIFRERQAEFVTDALRALLLEREGYDTKVFEFISTEHTAKNLMIAATRSAQPADRTAVAEKISALKHLYGIQTQRLETLLTK